MNKPLILVSAAERDVVINGEIVQRWGYFIPAWGPQQAQGQFVSKDAAIKYGNDRVNGWVAL